MLETSLTCRVCGISKPGDLFYDRKNRRRGKHSWCKSCHKKYRDEWTAKNVDRVKSYRRNLSAEDRRRHRIKHRHGISPQEYKEMFDRQGGVCLICGNLVSGKLAIDHCHSTGKIRGLLCNSCNGGLGLFKDNRKSLSAAIKYLEERA